MQRIKINSITFDGKSPFVLIAGPCVIESVEAALYHARALKKICATVNVPFIFKASYDKANRTSIHSYRGPGLKRGLAILAQVKKEVKVPVISDVHCVSEVREAADVLDIIQIPAFLSRQTDLLVAAAKTGRPINLKKGQFLAPWDMRHAIEKIESTGNRKIILTERGVSFGYNNLVSDLRSLSLMRQFGYPVIFDATHSVQLPGAKGESSGGQREFVDSLSRAALAFGCDGLFIEVHRNPEKALSDAANSLPLACVESLLSTVKQIDAIILKHKLR